jgi:hypothetical protein
VRIPDRVAETRTHFDATEGLRKRLSRTALGLAQLAVAVACGGGEREARAPIEREGPEEQILHVAATWEARWAEQGFRTAPNPIALFDTHVTSRLVFTRGQKAAREILEFESSFKLQDGSAFTCRARAETSAALAFGDRAGEAAVQVSRKPLRLSRTCDKLGFPEPEFALPMTRARFALRGDKLIGFDPPTERREYLPAD